MPVLAAACAGEPQRQPGPDGDDATDGSDGGDTATNGDSGVPSCGAVTFTPDVGEAVDLTEALTRGDEVLLDQDGQLDVCTGTWFSVVTVRAAVRVVGGSDDPEETVLSGGGFGSVLVVEGAGASLVVERVVLERGEARGDGNKAAGGGLRCIDGAAAALTDVIVRDNVAYDGGGLYGGGGCTLAVTRATLADNRSEDDGGALRLDDSSATLTDVVVTGSVAKDGGAVLAWQSDLTLHGGRFSDNRSTDSQGGAILHYAGHLQATGTVFQGNSSLVVGGALASFGPAALTDVRFESNESTEGGAVYVYTTNGRLACAACDFVGNAPDDVALDVGGSFTFGVAADLECDADGCR